MTPNTTTTESLAQEAYSRYGATTDYKNYRGELMPTWEDLPHKQKEAWVAAANPSERQLLFADLHINVCRVQGLLQGIESMVAQLRAAA